MPLFELLPERPKLPLLPGGLIEPEGVTILYGSPGSKKGVVASWQAMELVKAGYRVAILDFEGRQRQWRERLINIPLRSLYYYDAEEPIDKVQDEIEEEVLEDFKPHVLIIDSGSMAIPELRGMPESTCVRRMYRILKGWQRPALLLHHVSKADMRGSDALPLGTVQWYAQARLAINIDNEGGLITLTFKKANDRVEPTPIHCQWDWLTHKMQIVEIPEPTGQSPYFTPPSVIPSMLDMCLETLKDSEAHMSIHQIVKSIKLRYGVDRKESSVRFTLDHAIKGGNQLVRRIERNVYAWQYPSQSLD